MIRRAFIIFLLFTLNIVQGMRAQQNTADSISSLARTAASDTARISYLMELAWEVSDTNCDSAIGISTQTLYKINTLLLNTEETETRNKISIDRALLFHQLGVFHHLKSDYFSALQNYYKSLEAWEEIEASRFFGKPEVYSKEVLFRKAKTVGNIGITKWAQGDYPKALDFFITALKMSEKEKNDQAIAKWLGNIGIIYYEQKNYAKALEYYVRALKLSERLSDSFGISTQLSKIGVVYKDQGKYKEALDHFFRAIKITEEIGDNDGTTILTGNIGAAYVGINDLSKGIEYYFRALDMDKQAGNKNGILRHLRNIGMVYTIQNRFVEAEKYLKEALAISEEIGSMSELRDGHLFLSDMYSESRQYEKALMHYKQYNLLTDSLFNAEKQNELTKHEMNYEFEKKELALKAEQEKRDAVAVTDKRRQEAFFLLVCAIALAIAIIAMVIFRSLRITRKQKFIIEDQKTIVEVKQKEILDSIYYARRIQRSSLPSESYIEKCLDRLRH